MQVHSTLESEAARVILRDEKQMQIQIHQETTRYQGTWLTFKEVEFKDPVHLQTRRWEFVERTGHRSNEVVDAVEILATLKRANHQDHLILVKQYRPPTGRYCIEFPAGLVDKGESIEEAAARELREETGFTITRILDITPVLFYEPGLTNSDTRVVRAEIIGDSDDVDVPLSCPESDEWSLQTLLLPIENLMDQLKALQQDPTVAIDGKLYTFALGLEFSKRGSGRA